MPGIQETPNSRELARLLAEDNTHVSAEAKAMLRLLEQQRVEFLVPDRQEIVRLRGEVAALEAQLLTERAKFAHAQQQAKEAAQELRKERQLRLHAEHEAEEAPPRGCLARSRSALRLCRGWGRRTR